MGSISKGYGHDAGKFKPRPKFVIRQTPTGPERREIRQVHGITERFVNKAGNVVTIQLRKLGDPPTKAIVDRNRGEHRRLGFVEHGQCPLSSGAMRDSSLLRDEMANRPTDLRDACDKDPVVERRIKVDGKMVVEQGDGCPHIEWLILYRRDKEAKRVAAKGARPMSLADHQLDIQRQQLEEQRKTTRELVEVLKDSKKKRASD